ncbi:MAG: hypothetical protein ACAH59_03875 [Pseudobdellovibrionaceae bacterium]
MEWIQIENNESEAAQILLKWADDKSNQDCEMPEECCGILSDL